MYAYIGMHVHAASCILTKTNFLESLVPSLPQAQYHLWLVQGSVPIKVRVF